MSIFDTQNPGIGGLDELTLAEELVVQQIAALGDPGSDRILFWDDSESSYAFLTPGTNLVITGATLNATGGGHTIQDEGTPLTQRTNLNFVGASVLVTDDAGNDATVVTITSGGGSGDVVGPASATDLAVARYDGTTGKLIQNSTVTIDDDGDIAGVNTIQFDTTPVATTVTEGMLQWNATDGTLDLGMNGGNIKMQLGQETFTKVRNNTGATINNGTVVYFNGSLGNRPTIDKARSDIDSTSRAQGLLTEDLADNTDGFITTSGYVRQIKTDYTGAGIWGTTWVEGDLLFVSKTDAGVITNVEPATPHHADIIGTVGIVGAVGIGSILVNIDRHLRLEGLSDVNGTALSTDGQIPVWNNTTGYFDFTENILDRVEGPASATNNDIAVFDLTTGKLIKDGGATIAQVRDRLTHTGTQASTTISDFSTAADARIAAAAGVSIASLSGGKVPTSQLPALALTDVFTVASQVAQLALTAEEGDVAIRTDLNKSYIHNGGVSGTMTDWSELLTPTDTVLSVNGETGAVTLTTDDISDVAQTNKWATAAEKTKLGFIGVTQTVDLDAIETNSNASKVKTDFLTVTQPVDLDTLESDTATNNAKVTNATHTGEVTGATSLTVDKTAVTNKTTTTPVAGDFILFSDTSDSGNLKKANFSDFGGGGGGSATAVYIDQTPDNGTYGLLGGTVNGSNTVFTVAEAAYTTGELSVYLNGQLLTQGASNDYQETTPASGTFTFITAPATGDVVTAMYQKDITVATAIAGQATVDFGVSTTEDSIARVTINTASALTASVIIVNPSGQATADHDPDDYQWDNISGYATNIVDGVSFDIVGVAPNGSWGDYIFNYVIQ